MLEDELGLTQPVEDNSPPMVGNLSMCMQNDKPEVTKNRNKTKVKCVRGDEKVKPIRCDDKIDEKVKSIRCDETIVDTAAEDSTARASTRY